MKKNIALWLALLLVLTSCGVEKNTSSTWAITGETPAQELTWNAVIEVPNPHPLAGKVLIFDVEMVEISKWEGNNEANTVESGDAVKVHYIWTLENGEKFDSSRDRGETLSFTVGAGQMIPGFDAGVVGMKLSESKELTLSPEDAYGPASFTQTIPLSRLQEFANAGFELTPGTTLPTDRGEITILELQK